MLVAWALVGFGAVAAERSTDPRQATEEAAGTDEAARSTTREPPRAEPPRTTPEAPSAPGVVSPRARQPGAASEAAEAARRRAEDARRRSDEIRGRMRPTEAPEVPGGRPAPPVDRIEVPPELVEADPGGGVFQPLAIEDVAWHLDGLEPCPDYLPCPDAEGAVFVPMSDGPMVAQVTLRVEAWAGYKALTFSASESGAELAARFHDPKGTQEQVTLWEESGSEAALFFSVGEPTPASFEVTVASSSGVETPVEKRLFVIVVPAPKDPGDGGEDPEPEGDCNILQGKCGADLQTVTVDGETFAAAVWAASADHGEIPFEMLGGNCAFYGGETSTASVHLLDSGGICEFKLFTGGLSHSRMRKHCLIASWEATQEHHEVVPPIDVTILDSPDPWTRQKQWHVRLTAGPHALGPAFLSFRIESVELRIPEDAPALSGSDVDGIREFCFE